MMEKGHTQISPFWAVLLSSSMYTLQICQRPTNKEKVMNWMTPGLMYIKNLFGFKSKKVEKEQTPENVQNISSSGQESD